MAEERPRLTCAGKAVALLVTIAVVSVLAYGGYALLRQAGILASGPGAQDAPGPGSGSASGPGAGGTTAGPDGGTTPAAPAAGGAAGSTDSGASASRPAVTIGIAYGTEKERWLEWATEEFAKTEDGRWVDVDLIPMGSLEGAQAILAGDERIHVWSPASSLYRDVFVQEWQVKHGGGSPLLTDEPLALSPMVFVFWEERYQAFVERYGEASFETIGQALAEPGGWDAIASRPEWGLFKVGHTNPNQSNSGLATLVLMAYDYADKSRGLELADILDVGFQDWMRSFESAVSGLANSTGNMMREMVLKGPSSYDALVVYENVAIDYLENAEGRWGRLAIAYPRINAWNDNPYCIVDVPWSTEDHREAARLFLAFLLTERIQRQALVHGFRPADPAVPVLDPESPFTRYEPFGLEVDLTTVVDAPTADVINNLLASWQRGRTPR